MKVNLKILLPALGGAILVVGSAWLLSNDRSSEGETDGQTLVSRRLGKKVGGTVTKKTVRKTKSSEKKVRAAVQVKPAFDIGKDEEDRLSEEQRKLIAEIRAALRADDHKTLMKLVRQMQASKEWPDGIPKAVKKAALDALGWYGGKCLPEIIGFLADADSEIVSKAADYWEDAIAECDSDRDVAEQVKLATRAINDIESVESILVEIMNMRHSVAVATLKDVLANGNEIAKQKVFETISDYTDDPSIKTEGQLDEWLENHPDDPGDEEMYGGIKDEDV